MGSQQSKKQTGRVLIIEDSFAIRGLIKQVITFQKDYEVVLAKDGGIGLDIIKKSEPFDVILMDMEMNEMHGDECLREIRKLPDPIKAKTVVIACTGNAKGHTPQEFKEMGFDGSFEKPIDYRFLMKDIKPILDKE